jgi:RNA polymerase sigma-70 factor (ECF subfamily)
MERNKLRGKYVLIVEVLMGRLSETDTSANTRVIGLVKSAVNGDIDAYGSLYELFLDRIYRYVYYQVRDVMTAEDITQEVFIKAWNSIKSCRGKEQTFSAWLYRIAHNHTVDRFRVAHQDLPLYESVQADSANMEQQVELSLEYQKVLQLVSSLPEAQKQVIMLKFLQGVDNTEIEQITGKRQGAIRALQMRALESLRKQLNMGGDGNDR